MTEALEVRSVRGAIMRGIARYLRSVGYTEVSDPMDHEGTSCTINFHMDTEFLGDRITCYNGYRLICECCKYIGIEDDPYGNIPPDCIRLYSFIAWAPSHPSERIVSMGDPRLYSKILDYIRYVDSLPLWMKPEGQTS